MLAGALAGLGGAVERMGIQPRYIWNGTFPAITVVGVLAAILVDYNPAWVPLSALFLTYLWSGASALAAQSGFPEELALAARGRWWCWFCLRCGRCGSPMVW